MTSQATETWESRVAAEWAAHLWCRPENAQREMDVDFTTSIANAIQPYLAPFSALDGHDRLRLQEIATALKQRNGEQWAVGEALERMCTLLDRHALPAPHGSAV